MSGRNGRHANPQGWHSAGATVSSEKGGELSPRGVWGRLGTYRPRFHVCCKTGKTGILRYLPSLLKNNQTFNILRRLKITEQEASVLLSEAVSHSAGDSGLHPLPVLGASELEDVRVPFSALRIWDSSENRPVSLRPQKCSNALRPPGGSSQIRGSSCMKKWDKLVR